MQIFIINGRPGCGKTTFESLVRDVVPGTIIVSTVDFVKDIAKKCGWNGEKTLKNRKFLSDLKDLLTNWDDVPFKKVCEVIKNSPCAPAVFVDSREPKEIERFCKELSATSVLIRRAQVENIETSNASDANVFNYDYDITINNNGTLEELKEEVNKFIKNRGLI